MNDVLAERDLQALMTIVEDGRRDAPTQGLPWSVIEGLAKLVHCESLSFPEVDLVQGHPVIMQWIEDDGRRGFDIGDGDTEDPPEYWEYVRKFLPCSYPQRTGDLISVVRWSDFYTPIQLRDTPLYSEFLRQEGTKHGMHASFPTLPGHFLKISFWRDVGPDFSERDRLVIQLLRPHLYEIYLDSQRRRRDVPSLSPREWEVLCLAHHGWSNATIARELFISVATVRKHLEHVYDRTGTRTRAAAAALMIPHRPPLGPGDTHVRNAQ